MSLGRVTLSLLGDGICFELGKVICINVVMGIQMWVSLCQLLWHQSLAQMWTWVAPVTLLPGKLEYTCHAPTLQPGFLSRCPALEFGYNLWFFVCLFFNLKLKQLELSASQVSKMWLSSAPGTSHVIFVVGQYVLLNIR